MLTYTISIIIIFCAAFNDSDLLRIFNTDLKIILPSSSGLPETNSEVLPYIIPPSVVPSTTTQSLLICEFLRGQSTTK